MDCNCGKSKCNQYAESLFPRFFKNLRKHPDDCPDKETHYTEGGTFRHMRRNRKCKKCNDSRKEQKDRRIIRDFFRYKAVHHVNQKCNEKNRQQIFKCRPDIIHNSLYQVQFPASQSINLIIPHKITGCKNHRRTSDCSGNTARNHPCIYFFLPANPENQSCNRNQTNRRAEIFICPSDQKTPEEHSYCSRNARAGT